MRNVIINMAGGVVCEQQQNKWIREEAGVKHVHAKHSLYFLMAQCMSFIVIV